MLLGFLSIASDAQTLASNWVQQSPANSPPARFDDAMTYDGTHGQVVVFGGFSVNGIANDTWLWNGTNWTQASPANSPSARSAVAMAYDAATGQTVLFGGANSNGTRLGDTWLWDGTNWTQASPGTSPAARNSHAMAYDAATGQVILFGGVDINGNVLGDTWAWNGTTWIQQSPASSPSARFDHSMAYDAAHGQIVLFGGLYSGDLGDTWLWNGTNWIQQSPAASPAVRDSEGMAYDAVLGQVVLFGGYNGSYFNDTWFWNGTNWTQDTPVTTPSARYFPNGMVYDSANSQLVMFGGTNGGTDLGDTWQFGLPGNFGNVNVCPSGNTTPAPCSITQTLTYQVTNGGAYGTPQVVTQGASGLDFSLVSSGTTCTGTVAPGTCTVSVTFTPLAPGLRAGAVQLFGYTGNLLASTPIYGNGQGPAVVFAPAISGTNILGGPVLENPVTTPGYTPSPRGLATDAAGDLYIADPGQQLLLKRTANGTVTTVSGPSAPQAVAIDGAGDLFIADTGLQEVLEIPAGCITTACQFAVYKPSPASPVGVAVDGQGDLFVADGYSATVVEVPAGCTASSCWITVGSGWSSLNSLAVDAAGDLFVTDSGLGKVLKMPAGCTVNSCQATVGSGWLYPHGLALDAAGDVYVSDTGLGGSGQVLKIPAGCASSACEVVLLNGAIVYDLAADGLGQIYAAEGINNQILEINQSQPPTFNFDSTYVGYTSDDSPQSFTVLNVGNQTLSHTAPGLIVAGSPYAQIFGTTQVADCTSTFSLAPGAGCNLSLQFRPTAQGTYGSVSVFTDNALNVSGAQQVVYSYGSGLNPTQTIAVSGAGSGNGSVSSNPTGISCNELAGVSSGTCSANFIGGQVVLLQEIPSTGSTFAGWGGACTSYGQSQVCQVTLNSSSSAIATFSLSTTLPLNVSLAGNGSGSVFDQAQQISCTETAGITAGICATNYQSGAVVTLTASAITGSVFVGWGGGCVSFGVSPTCILTMNSAETVTATYLVAGTSQAGILKPITAGIVYGQGGSFTSATQNNGGASANSLYSPTALAFDGGGNLYVADRANNRVLYYPAGSTTATRVYGQNGSFTSNAANNGGVSANSLSQPWGVALDSAGNLYISDYSNNRVLYYPAGSTTATRVYGQSGSFTTNTANSGGVSANSISIPQGLALDSAGNLYVSDSNARVLFYPAGSTTATRVYGQNGDFTAIIQNNGGVSANSLSNPQMLAVDSSGDLYVADSSNNRVLFYPVGSTTATQVYGQGGSLTSSTADNGGVSANSLSQPWGVALDSSGDLYVAEYSSGRALFYPFGSTTSTRVYGQGGSFTSDTLNNGGVTANSLSQPASVALDRNGDLYVADTYNNRVLEYGTFGNINVCPTGQTTPAPCSSTLTFALNAPTNTTIGAVQVITQGAAGLDFNPGTGSTCTGTVFASCNVNVTFTPLAPGLRKGALQVFDNNGNPVASAPISGVGQAPFLAFGPAVQTTLPTMGLHYNVGVATDGAGNVYVADYTAAKVVKITPGGTQSTVPATGLSAPVGVAVDGAGDLFIVDLSLPYAVEITPAGVQTTVGSGLNYAIGIALDAIGNVYIADQNNNRVVMVTPGGVQTTVPTTGLNQPYGVAVDASGNIFIADGGNSRVVEVTPAGIQSNVSATGLGQPYGVAVDAAGDVLIADPLNARVVELPTGCAVAACQITVGSGLNYPSGVALDGLGNIYVGDQGLGQVFKINSSQPPSLSFATTNAGSTSTDSPQPVVLQNIGNQTVTGSITLNLGSSFSRNAAQNCLGSISLAPGAVCTESFSFTPQSTTYFSGSASLFDNNFNLAGGTQTINLSGNGATSGVAGTVAVPNLTGQPQTAAATPLAAVGLVLGTVSTTTSDTFPTGTVINQNPAAGIQVNAGSAVNLLVSSGVSLPPSPNPLNFENNYFLTGDYVTAGVTLHGLGQGGFATGTITVPSYASNPTQGVPDGADIVDAFLYWETVENTASASSLIATFNGYSVTGQQIGTDIPNYVDGALTGTLRAYRAPVNVYLPVGAGGTRFATGNYSVTLPDGGGAALPLTEGASLVFVYRVLSPNFPLKSVVIYDGSAQPATTATQLVQGFYDAVGGANSSGKATNIFAANGTWNSASSTITLGSPNQYSADLNAPGAYAAVILSTPVNNSDNDGILDAWKAGPGAGDFHVGQPGYYDVKTQNWVGLPGAKHGQKDLFVQLDYMCGAVLTNGSCDSTKENLFPSPDSSGNDPLAMVQQAFANSGVQLHLTIGNAVAEDTCTDGSQLCQFPGQSGVIGWKNSLEFSKLWPRNFVACITGGDCTTRFPYGQKDSYHYVLMGHSLAIPAWNSRYGTLTSITVANGVTTIGTADRGAGNINSCPSRITLSGILGNPGLNGVYNTASCPDTKTILVQTPGVPNWSYPNATLAEPVIGLTNGTVSSISGYSDLGGADSAVTLGLWLTAPNQDMSKRANVLAGTIFHEIGHTLGLGHGGIYYDTPGSYVPTYDANCKPNYQSVMNYLFQLDLLGPNQALAFSNQALQSVNENSAGSIAQLTDSFGNPATFPTSAWYVPYTSGSPASPATRHCDGTPLIGDSAYRVDSSIAPITPVWANGQDLSFIGILQSNERGFNDLTNMDLRQIGATGGEFASLANVLNFGASSAPLNISAGGAVTLGSGGTVALGSGGNVTLASGANVTLGSSGVITLGSGGNLTLGNGGTATLNSAATVTPGSNGLVTLGSGGTVTLGSGGVITLGSGGLITLGSGGLVTLGSGGVITLGSGGTTINVPATGGSYSVPAGGVITLGSGGVVTLGSGGLVTLGSGGVIALGSGGVVTLGSGGLVTLGSGGLITMGSGGLVTLGSGGNVTLGSGGLITLGSGGLITLGSGGLVALGSGGTVTLGSGGNLTDSQGGNVTLGSGGQASLGAGGTVTLSSGGVVTLGSGGLVTLGSGGVITLGSGGLITLGSGGLITLGSGGAPFPISAGNSYTFPAGGGTVTLGSGGLVTLGSGGLVTLGSGGVITLGSGGLVTLGSGGVVTLGSGGTIIEGIGSTISLGSVNNITPASGGPLAANELTYETANSVVRPPSSPTETSTPAGVLITWKAPAFGVVQTYTVYRSSNGATPIVIGSVSGVNGNPPATEFTDTNPDLTSATVVYTITTTLVADPGGAQRQSPASPPAVLKNNQSIVLGPLPSSVTITNPPTVTATAMSAGVPNGLQVLFSATGSCSIGSQSIASNVSSATVALTGTGSCTVTAAQPGTTAFNAANSVSGTFLILPQGSGTQSQTITFPSLQNVQYGNTFSLNASSSAGLPVSFAASGPCTTSGTVSGVGNCKITASSAGNSTYSAASLTQSFTVFPAVLKVTATSLTSNYGQPLPAFTYAYSGFVNSETATVVSGAPALTSTATATSAAGSYPIIVSTGTLATPNYSFLYVNGTLTVQTASQSALTLITTSPLTYNQSETLSVTGGSTNGAVTYNASGACSITGAQLTAGSGTGACQVTATMAGNTDYSSVTSTPANVVTLGLANQTIMFTTNPPASAAVNSTFTVAATATSGLAVTFTSAGSCSNTGAIYKMTGGGSCSVIASQAGNTNYAPAAPVSKTVNGILATPTVTFTGAPTSAAYRSVFTVVATTNASTTAVITSTGACSNAGTTVTMTAGTGTCSLSATWAADVHYSGATAGQSTAAALAGQSITFTTNPPASAAFNSSFTVAANATSGNAVSFSSAGSCSNTGAIYKITSGAGTCSVIANAAANANYALAAPITKTVTATQAAPTVTFTGAPASATYKSAFTVASTTNGSTAAVITSGGACSNVGTAVTMTSGTGTCSLTAMWAAGGNYSGATATQFTTAALASQAITFTTNPPASASYASTFTVAATGGASGNPVVFTSAGSCSNSGATYTMTNSTGSCSVIATQAGNANYASATPATKIVTAVGPLLSVSPSTINFGTVYAGSISTNNITLTNTGTMPVTINDPILSIVKGGNSNEFIALSLCPKPLAAGKSCVVTIAFLAGPFYTPQTATLQIMSNAPGSPQPVALSATVINPQASANVKSLNFGTIKHGTSSTMSLVLSNTGATPLTLTSLSVTGVNATSFAQTNNCGSSLAASASCTIAVKFTPATTGTFSANLTLVDNAQSGGGTQAIPLTGNGN